MISRNAFNVLPLSIFGAGLLITISVVLWAADKGLGFGDEGIYLLASRYPGEIQQNVSAIFSFTGHLFKLINYNPILYRQAGVVLVILSAVVFWYGFLKLLLALQSEAVRIQYLNYYSLLFVVAGCLLHYQWSYLTPSYYTLTAVVVNLFAGCIFIGLAGLDPTRKKLSPYIAYFVAGIIFGLTLFFKFPTAIPLLFCAIALTFLQADVALFVRLRLLISILCGFLVWLVIYFSFEQTPTRTLELFKEGWTLYQTLGHHNPIDKLLTYPKDLLVLLYTALFEYWPCYLMIALGAGAGVAFNKVSCFPKAQRFWRLLIWGVVVLALVISFDDGLNVEVPDRFLTSPVEGRTRPYLAFELAWILLLGVLYLLGSYKIDSKFFYLDKTLLFFLFLLIAPVTGSLGTSNPVFNVIQFYAVPWFGAIFLLLTILIVRTGAGGGLMAIVVIGVSTYVCSHVVQGGTFAPAQLKPLSLYDQSVPTPVGNPAYILNLDTETSSVVQKLSIAAKANGFQPGDDIIAFREIPGLVYALGGRSPGHPVYPCCLSERANAYTRQALTFSDPARLKKSFVLLDVDPTLDIPSILGSVGINFPADYQIVTRVNGLGRNFIMYRPK